MGLTNFPNGLSSFGSPVVGARFSSPWATHYFVDGDLGSDNNSGKNPTKAVKTIAKAVSLAVGGDVIYIKPKTYTLGTGFARYTEDVTVTLGGDGGSGATAINANISLIGVSQRQVPSDFLGVRWKFATATPLTVNAPGLHVENIGFFTEDATYAINLQCNGATRTQEGTTGFSIYNSSIKGDGKLYANGGDGIQIVHCVFQAKYDGTVGGINLVGSTNQNKRTVIRDCEFIGGNANNMSAAAIIGAAPVYDIVIRDCYFNAESDTGEYINISGTNSGIVANCYFASADIGTTSLVGIGIFGSGCYDDDGLQAAPIAQS